MNGVSRVALSGWARFPVETCDLLRPERRAAVAGILRSGRWRSYIARGLGRSYGDAALNAGGAVISQERLDRLLAFDPETGVVDCEAGVSFDDLVRVFLPRGFFPAVTPGTRFVTVGGAIASDVHGKNHHRDGTIVSSLVALTLLTPGGELIACSPSTASDVFWATVGGMGLTGVIVTVSLQLRPVESAYVRVDRQRAGSLDEALALFAGSDDRYQYSVAWIDGLAGGAATGRCVLMRGNHASAADLPRSVRAPLALPARRSHAVPFDLPGGLLNHLTVGAFNALFYRWHRDAADRLVDVASFFYPLDAVTHWNRIYGRRGFVQYQIVVPPAASPRVLATVLERLRRTGRPSFLAVLKRFGPGNPGLLSFPRQGYTLALDLPVTPGLGEELDALDELVVSHGGRVYLAKDARLRPDVFAAMYPDLGRFRAIKARLDPDGLLSSSLARRLRIVDR